MEFHGERLTHCRLSQSVVGQRRRGALRRAALRGGRGRAGQRRERDVAGRFAPRRAVLALEFGCEAVQRAGPDVSRAGGGVGDAGAGRAALRRVSTNWEEKTRRITERSS